MRCAMLGVEIQYSHKGSMVFNRLVSIRLHENVYDDEFKERQLLCD